jgi:hypothetical protein
LPNFLIEETTVSQDGESRVLFLGESANHHLLLTLCISHVVERQNLDVDILASQDGVVWSPQPVANFLQKFCCGRYDMILFNSNIQFLKAVWRVSHWGRDSHRSLCRFSLSVQDASRLSHTSRAMAGAA